MDPEKQPLLNPVSPNVRQRRYSFRALSPEEVLDYRHEATWRRARFFLVIMFWSVIAMCISIITCILLTSNACKTVDIMERPPSLNLARMPIVPPVHLSMTPLIFVRRDASMDPHNNM